jgi:phosphoserine phosphatase
MQPTAVLATLSGRDRPGVTASFCAALAAHDVEIREVEQVVIRDRLILAVLFDLRGDPSALRGSLTKAAAALGMESEVVVAGDDVAQVSDGGARTHVTLLGRPLRPGALGHLAQHIADQGGNIDSIVHAPDDPTPCLELTVRSPDADRLRGALIRAAKDIGVDIAVQRHALRRCAKRLVMLDVGSTLLPDGAAEAIDLLAERAGVTEEIERIAAREHAGELGDAEALRARASLLAGLSESEVRATCARTRLRPEAHTFTRTLRRLGYRLGAVSGGFGLPPERLAAELELDFVAANQLETRDGVVTGRVVEPVVDAVGKAGALVDFAASQGVPMAQSVAVGAGGTDLQMLQAAGLGIACTGAASSNSYFDSVMVVLGVGEDVRREALIDG